MTNSELDHPGRIYLGVSRQLPISKLPEQFQTNSVSHSVTQINDIDFKDSVLVLGFSQDLNDVLFQLYQDNCKEIREILSSMSMDLPHYHNLEWRFEVQLASRSLQRQTQPKVMLRLHTKENGMCAHLKCRVHTHTLTQTDTHTHAYTHT